MEYSGYKFIQGMAACTAPCQVVKSSSVGYARVAPPMLPHRSTASAWVIKVPSKWRQYPEWNSKPPAQPGIKTIYMTHIIYCSHWNMVYTRFVLKLHLQYISSFMILDNFVFFQKNKQYFVLLNKICIFYPVTIFV